MPQDWKNQPRGAGRDSREDVEGSQGRDHTPMGTHTAGSVQHRVLWASDSTWHLHHWTALERGMRHQSSNLV